MPPPPLTPDGEMTIRKLGQLLLANFDHFWYLKKKITFDPHHIHLRVQHVPPINLMGLMTFFEQNSFRDFGPLLASQNKVWHHLPQEGQRSFVLVIWSSRAPESPPPPTHQNKYITVIPIPGLHKPS